LEWVLLEFRQRLHHPRGPPPYPPG
jgi:hypothetical protein